MFQDLDVLIIDADRDQRAGLRERLEANGCTVAEASSERQALSYLLTSAEAPSAILLDLQAEDTSGQRFLELLGAYPPLSSIPVIVVSAATPQQAPLPRPVARRFMKPVDAAQLLKAIDEIVLARRRERSWRRKARGGAREPLDGAPHRPRTPSEGRLVLVIDDDAEARASLRTLLTDAEFDVVEAADGEEAIHYLTAKRADPALIVTDLAMPDMNGWELINVLQAYVRLSTIPVLVVSGKDLHERPVREEGLLEFFAKPLDTRRFLSAARRHALTAAQREARRRDAMNKLAQSPF